MIQEQEILSTLTLRTILLYLETKRPYLYHDQRHQETPRPHAGLYVQECPRVRV